MGAGGGTFVLEAEEEAKDLLEILPPTSTIGSPSGSLALGPPGGTGSIALTLVNRYSGFRWARLSEGYLRGLQPDNEIALYLE